MLHGAERAHGLLLLQEHAVGDERTGGHAMAVRVVEIDETSLKKSKYNRGRRFPNYWIFGGVDRTTNCWFGIETYEDHTKPTLTPIMSDQFASYISVNGEHTLANNQLLSDMNYNHLWMNHSKGFIDPITGSHRIEGAWEIRIKQHVKALLPMYRDEYLWRSWFAPPQATVPEAMRALVTDRQGEPQVAEWMYKLPIGLAIAGKYVSPPNTLE
ncbi:hypothetical protein PF008_g2739 [Phytophthora fragariae]|uniref:ISXO2-like transposase domain-containing protein n=1 Tax=Phytophthora fragariae TaxID=53985 RepID=A0A6G0SG90_9STRA|nr:hypothetical protein PF008_g2739 [Phytophthora fragariae]